MLAVTHLILLNILTHVVFRVSQLLTLVGVPSYCCVFGDKLVGFSFQCTDVYLKCTEFKYQWKYFKRILFPLCLIFFNPHLWLNVVIVVIIWILKKPQNFLIFKCLSTLIALQCKYSTLVFMNCHISTRDKWSLSIYSRNWVSFLAQKSRIWNVCMCHCTDREVKKKKIEEMYCYCQIGKKYFLLRNGSTKTLEIWINLMQKWKITSPSYTSKLA